MSSVSTGRQRSGRAPASDGAQRGLGRHRAPRRGRPLLPVIVVVLVLGTASAACTVGSADESVGGAPRTSSPAPATAAPATAAPATAPPPTAPPSTLPPFTATTTATSTVAIAPAGSCSTGSGTGATDPLALDDAALRLAPALDRLRVAGARVGVSVWVDGVGEVVAVEPQTPLVPASNQKLFIAFAALELLPLDTTLPTTVVSTGPVVDGVLQGDLVLVGGGDPTITRAGPHSLDALAAQVQAAGISGVTGRLLVDETRYDEVRTGSGWADGAWQQSNVGLLSALVVDRNRNNPDPAFAADPTLANLRSFRTALGDAGVTVAGFDDRGSGQAGVQVAALASPPLPELITALLTRSDNLAAELLLKEIGWRTTGVGSAAAGIESARASLAARCVPVDGIDSDGSGLSRTDTRSPGAWRRLLEVARTRPWFGTFRDALAVSGSSGTLATRLGGADTAGRVQAKTGSTAVSGALSGYLTGASGSTVVFSVVVNQPAGAPEPAIDGFVTALVREL